METTERQSDTPLHPSREGITKKQIKKIHTLKGAIGMNKDQYRRMVQEIHGFSGTSKDLSFNEAETLVQRLEAIAIPMGVWKRYEVRQSKKKYDDLGKRKGMASPRQLRMIEAMWKDASWTHDEAKRQVALRRFIFRIAAVDDIVFLTSQGANKVITAIQSMKRKHTQPHKDRVYGGV